MLREKKCDNNSSLIVKLKPFEVNTKEGSPASSTIQPKHQTSSTCMHASQMGGVYAAMLMLWRSTQRMSRGIRDPKVEVSRFGKRLLQGWGQCWVGRIGADSGIQRPGELRQTRLQDTDTITGLAVLLIFINSHPRTLAREGESGAPLESHADV